MCKRFLVAGVCLFIFIGIVGGWWLFRPEQTLPEVRPEVLQVARFQAVIAWSSEKPYTGRVLYQPAGSQSPPLSAEESFSASHHHEVTLSGLAPSTRYTYWIDGTESRFQFQTQPSAAMPFSFLLVYGDIADRVLSLMMSEIPELILSLTPIAATGADPFANARAYLPIYGPAGTDSPFLRSLEDGNIGAEDSWNLDWGGLRLVFLRSGTDLTKLLDRPEAHTFGIFTSPERLGAFRAGDLADRDQVRQNTFHAELLAHNARHPAQPIAFVAVPGERDDVIELDGIRYVGIPVQQAAGAIRLDVDVESIYATFLETGREVILRHPPLAEKRSCEECRRLADTGAYEESVQAYMAFIENNQGHYQIEDAYFAIAEILDEKLFQFEAALRWYRRLIEEYPDGTLTPLGKQRIQYLSRYAEYNFEPLTRFERIKKVELARQQQNPEERDSLLQEVAAIVTEYPESKLAPVMLYWLAGQYGQSSIDKAAETYRQLQQSYPHHPDAREALVEIGELYYDAERYQEARDVYRQALSELPDLADTILAQIQRCDRNLRRETIALVCWGIVVLMGVLALVLKPSGLSPDTRRIFRLCVGLFVLASVLAFGAWLIHEQFTSAKEMLQLVIVFAIVANISAYLSMLSTEKLVFRKTLKGGGSTTAVRSVAVGSFIGGVSLLAGVYLSIYYINPHYLIIIGW